MGKEHGLVGCTGKGFGMGVFWDVVWVGVGVVWVRVLCGVEEGGGAWVWFEFECLNEKLDSLRDQVRGYTHASSSAGAIGVQS